MSFFVHTTRPTPLKSPNIKSVSLLLAAVLTVMAIAQLYTFEDFTSLVQSFWLPGGKPFGAFLAAFIVTSEVFALPFLLRMKLSPLARFLSMVLGWLAIGVWIFISIWLYTTVNAVANVGIMGDVVDVAPGFLPILYSLALGVLAAWSAWGMWPIWHKRK